MVALISGSEKANNNTLKIVNALLKNGADANSLVTLPDPILNNAKASISPLMILMWYKKCNLELVKLLIEQGANLNYKNEFGMNPLFWAVCNPNGTDRAKILISSSADIDIVIFEDKIKNIGSKELNRKGGKKKKKKFSNV